LPASTAAANDYVMAPSKVLIVDDEKNIVEAVKYALEKDGFRTLVAHDGARALELAARELPDLIVLDWMLPSVDGLEVCRLLHQQPATSGIPVLMLTVKSDETDKVLGLEMGADDYMTKPFSPRELVARIKALLRRAKPKPADEVTRFKDLQVDWGRHLVTVKGKAVELTTKEFELLRALLEARGRVLSREALLDKVWGYDRAVEIETRTVDLHISQLRKKLRHLSGHIVTVKNAGYRFADETG
jgi:two-component system alkaline phosphatase synthesis response regulator PhoP